MVSIMRYIFLISLVALTACKKNEFNLEFHLADDVTENYNVTYYATDTHGGVTVQAVASVREGKCELKGATKKPTLIYLSKRNSKLPLVLLTEKGEKIEISGESSNPLEWSVEGNEINKELTQWRLENKKIFEKCESDSVNEIVSLYVKENENNPVSTILLLCYFNRLIDERGYSDLMSGLKGKARETDLLNLIGRSDQMFHQYSYPAKVENLVLKSTSGNRDTLILNKKDPTLLLFWNIGISERKNIIDSIKVLEKEFPDSVRFISDFCLDIDSVGWRSALRKDSLYYEMKRFWVPEGLTNSTVMKLKVKKLPYYIVLNKKGEQSYSGGDIREALKEYRSLMNEEDTTKENKNKK